MVVQGEIRGGWCAERIPAHCCVQFEGGFLGQSGGKEREELGWSEVPSRYGKRGREEEEESGCGKVGVRRGGTTSLCIFEDERRKWRRGRKLNLFYFIYLSVIAVSRGLFNSNHRPRSLA